MKFTIEIDDKYLLIHGPFEISPIAIDYDDVDQARVEKDAYRLVNILNDHWKPCK